MNQQELERALRGLRLGRMAETLPTRILQAQSERLAPIDFISLLVRDELERRADRVLQRRVARARFRDANKTLDSFEFEFNRKINKKLLYELAGCEFINKHEDVLFLGPPGTGKSHLAQAIGNAAIKQGYSVLYREAHVLMEELADATLDGKRSEVLSELADADFLIIDDLGMRKLPQNAAEELLELIMRRYEKRSTLITSNRPVDDWGKLLGDTAAVTAMLDRLLHHGHVLQCGPKSYRTKHHGALKDEAA